MQMSTFEQFLNGACMTMDVRCARILRTLMPHLASNVGSGMQPQRFASCPSIHHCNNQSKIFPYIYLSLRSAQHRNQQISIVTACTSSVFTQVNTKTLQQKCTFITQPQWMGNRGSGGTDLVLFCCGLGFGLSLRHDCSREEGAELLLLVIEGCSYFL